MDPIPIAESFLSMIRACVWQSPELLTFPATPPVSLRVCVGEGGTWSMGTAPASPYTMSSATFAELRAATLQVDEHGEPTGFYVSGGNARALYPNAGAALPGDIPPPPPPGN